jgi:outer membrane cobalamin receptor
MIFTRLTRPFTLTLALALAAPALAQQRVSISGTVTDPSGAVVPGAIVEVVVVGRPAASVTTDADGRYRVEVQAGQAHELSVRRQGFTAETAIVTPSSDTTRDVALGLAAVGDVLFVTAARTAETRASTMASVAVLSGDEVAALGSVSLGDVLRFVPGLSVESAGREGSLTSLFSRGGESDYNLVLIDGVRVNNTGGTFDVSRISAAEIDRVEIVRGGQSSLYGSDAMGSVVQVFTKRAGASDRPHAIGAVEAGSFATFRGDATLLGGARGRVDYKVGLTHRGTDGAFADLLPEKDRFDQTTFDGGFGVALGNRASVRGGLRYSNAQGRGLGPINYGSRDTGTAYDTTDASWRLGVNHRWAPTVNGAATVAYSRSNSASVDSVADPTYQLYAILSGTPGAGFPASPRLVRFVDLPTFNALRAGQAGLGVGEFLATTPFGVSDFPFTSRTRFRRPAFKYQADWMWRTGQSLAGGYEFERERDPLNAGFDFTNHAAFAQQQFELRDRWFVTLGGRVDSNSRYGTSASPKLSVGGYVLPFGGGAISSVKVFSNVGKGIKNPAFSELFDTTFADGNPDLQPERARTLDVGAEATFAGQRLRGTVTYFDNAYEDQVAFRSTGFGRDGRPDFVNIAGSKANGWELEAVMQRALVGLTAAASYALVDTEVTATTSTGAAFQPGQPLLRRPKHSGSLRLGYAAGRLAVNADARVVGQRHDSPFLGLSAVATGRSVDITVNPAYAVVGLGASYALVDEAAIFVRLDNVADEKYESALGYPGMPRAAFVGVRFGVGGR